MTDVTCTNCNFKGKVPLARQTKKFSKVNRKTGKRYLLAAPKSEKGKPVTAVPCPECGVHKLRRVRKVRSVA